jgi:hypothetical protein
MYRGGGNISPGLKEMIRADSAKSARMACRFSTSQTELSEDQRRGSAPPILWWASHMARGLLFCRSLVTNVIDFPGSANPRTMVDRDLEHLVRFSAIFDSRPARVSLRLVKSTDGEVPAPSRSGIEAEVERMRSILSPPAAKHFGALIRRGITPVVSGLGDGVCGQCNMAVPTGIVNAVMSNRAIHECLRCKRILVPRERLEGPGQSAS